MKDIYGTKPQKLVRQQMSLRTWKEYLCELFKVNETTPGNDYD